MKTSIMVGVDDEICRVLTPDTVDIHLREEILQYEKWAAGNQEYIRTLAESAPHKIPEEALKQFWGG